MGRVLAASVFAVSCLCALRLSGQASSVMTNQSVVALVSGKYNDAFIIDRIRSQPGAYNISPGDVQALENAGVSDTVIAAMALNQGSRGTPVQTVAQQSTGTPQTPPGQRVRLEDAIPRIPAVTPSQNNARGRRRGSGASPGGFDCRFDDGEWPRLDTSQERPNSAKVFYRDDNDCWQPLPGRRVTWSNSSMDKTVMFAMTMGMKKRPYTGTLERRYSQFAVHCGSGIVVYNMDFAVVPLRDISRGGRNITSPLNREADFHVVDRHGALQPDDMFKIEPFKPVADGEYGIFDYTAFRDGTGSQDMFSFHCLD